MKQLYRHSGVPRTVTILTLSCCVRPPPPLYKHVIYMVASWDNVYPSQHPRPCDFPEANLTSYFIRSIDTTRIPGQQRREEKAVNRMLLSNNFPQGILGTQCKTHTSKWSYPTSRELGSLYINPPHNHCWGLEKEGEGSQLLSCVGVHAWGDWLVLVWGTSRALSGMGGPRVCSVLLCSCNTNYNPDTSWLSQSQHFGINFCIIFHNGITTHLVLS